MTPNAIRWESPPLSTASVPAAIHYRDGIAALVSGNSTADRLLGAAIRLDERFLLAHVGLAVWRVTTGARWQAPTVEGCVVQRGERQHLEIVDTALSGDCGHAIDLRREHLLEFPGDLLIVWLPLLQRSMVP